jgi:putative transcriptional regulator
MSLIWFARLSLVVATGILPPTFREAAFQTPTQAPASGSLAGQLLIASPAMGDPRFQRTVILMVKHDRSGALGIVINRPLQERSLASLLAALGEQDTGVAGNVRIFAGGPVQPDVGFVVHSADYRRPETIDIDGRVAMTSSREILHDIGNNSGPKKTLVAFGYAGWRPGQLEEELSHGVWFTAAEDAALVFDVDRDKVWDDAMKRRTQDL